MSEKNMNNNSDVDEFMEGLRKIVEQMPGHKIHKELEEIIFKYDANTSLNSLLSFIIDNYDVEIKDISKQLRLFKKLREKYPRKCETINLNASKQ